MNPQNSFEKDQTSSLVNHDNFLNSIDLDRKYSEIRQEYRIEDELKPYKVERFPYGIINRYGFTTKSGHSFAAAVGIPKNNQITTIPTVFTTAWFTSTEGHNEHTLRSLVKEGVPTIMIGAEGSYHKNDCKLPNYHTRLAGSAAAVLNFTGVICHDYPTEIDEHERSVIGESRGAMTAMGILAMDKSFDQDVRYADITAPCFPRKILPKDILKLSGHIIHEPLSVSRLAGKIGRKRLIHYPSTIDLHPVSISSQLAIGVALFNGDTGEMARLIDKDKIIHITCYNDDFASMPKIWKGIFKNHSGVRITLLDGSHLTIADPQTLDFIIARRKSFQIENNEHRLDMDGQRIFDRAHQLVQLENSY